MPYLKFPAVAAVLAADGRVFSGVNVENTSCGLTIWAERVALFAAFAAGVSDVPAHACRRDRLFTEFR